jgi:hypothetical protein
MLLQAESIRRQQAETDLANMVAMMAGDDDDHCSSA